MTKLEAGDLNIHIDIESEDELGRLSQAFNHISATISNYVKDISEQLSQMADNNMDITITQNYIGDFIPIQVSIEKISQSLNDTFTSNCPFQQMTFLLVQKMCPLAHRYSLMVLKNKKAAAIQQLAVSIEVYQMM